MNARNMGSRFPASLFFVYFGVLLVMSGLHTGLMVLMRCLDTGKLFQILVILSYWALVAGGLTWFTRFQMQRTYETPMQNLAAATRKVAGGDFSVYIPPIHLGQQADYLDVMLEDFNKMVEELGSIETLKTDFFSNVSHEIKTPLAIIQSNAALLQQYGDDGEKREEYTAHIIQSTKRLSCLITNMLKLNKLEKQTILPKPQPYDLCAQLCACALSFEHLWEEKDIVLEAELQDRLIIEADESLLELVWNNLLSNALKFTAPGGRVLLCQTVEAHGIVVRVSDTGCGMSQETLKHIFDKFYQGDTSHATDGNGLGLALVRRVLHLMGGAIDVESAPGKGSVFRVTLPLSLMEGGNRPHGSALCLL